MAIKSDRQRHRECGLCSKRLQLEDVQADYICVSVIKLPVSTFELTFVATILGRSMTYDVVHERFPSNGYHVAQYLSSGRAPCRVHLPEADACTQVNRPSVPLFVHGSRIMVFSFPPSVASFIFVFHQRRKESISQKKPSRDRGSLPQRIAGPWY